VSLRKLRQDSTSVRTNATEPLGAKKEFLFGLHARSLAHRAFGPPPSVSLLQVANIGLVQPLVSSGEIRVVDFARASITPLLAAFR